MRDVYKYETLGEWIILHKENTDKILRKDGFMVALRYDIRIRANTFAHRVVKNGVKSFLDISIFRQEVYDTAYAEARRYKELIFKEVNPYAIGGVRASWDRTRVPKSRPSQPTTTNREAPPTQPSQVLRTQTPSQPSRAKAEEVLGIKAETLTQTTQGAKGRAAADTKMEKAAESR
ncbi:hypothetical protein PGT21_022392 [Puccinia graminis f. sp. tritici]|uniref:Uncharacterized protein n=1 Tax=Puccinia graminis f. sp. tritici TaxID=56615 RepID=A0A5B0LZY5_PUCGR|nr:hypothetical protein PGT21_022392 [Puccinia graminis f. sp. tritici]